MRKPLFFIPILLVIVALAVGAFRSSHPPIVTTAIPRKVKPVPQAEVTPMAGPSPSKATPPVSNLASVPQGSVHSATTPTTSAFGVAPMLAENFTSPTSATPPTAPNAQAAMIDLDKTRHMIQGYHTLMGENPVGTNAEIMKALMGANPHQAVLGPVEGQQLNGKGELVDPWGTPYFFHQLSGDVMEIHSAGPDKVMGTTDDFVVR